MKPEQFLRDGVGVGLLWSGLVLSVLTMLAYAVSLRRPGATGPRVLGRIAYGLTALSVLGTFAYLCHLVYTQQFRYKYVFEHTGTDLRGGALDFWYRLAATWSGQEGSFALWAAMTALIGFLVLWKAGPYEARVMPFYVSILSFLCGIMLWQSPFLIIPPPSPAELAANPDWVYPPVEGMGLNPSLQNYWMTIHPPTIFFGFSSLAVPFVYAIAALIWKDYEDWTPRVMPYALLSCATLGAGLFMGGYWAYETQGWHGFWAWDPVENASFFPWLAITALVHGLVVQKNRGGMARTNTFLGVLAFNLFLVGTLLTRSGALSGQGEDGQLLSVHAFANIESSALSLLIAMLGLYGLGGLLLWAYRYRSMPRRVTTGETLISRDFAMFMSVLLMIVACALITYGTTQPLFQTWLKKPIQQPKPAFYNTIMLPLTVLAALFMGFAPWMAWKRTNSEAFLKRLLVPWFAMLVFGFALLFWVLGQERAMAAAFDPSDPSQVQTRAAWISPTIQRVSVVLLTSLGFFAALSNAMLAYRVFRAKPLAAGGWLAHVGIGLFIVGAVVSNTYERTQRVLLVEGEPPREVFGYQLAFEKMTGTPMEFRPLNPEYDRNNAVRIRVTPPNADRGPGGADGGRTFTVEPRWFAHNLNRAVEQPMAEGVRSLEFMRWPHIEKFAFHDFYVGLANDPAYAWPTDDPRGERPGIVLKPKEKRTIGPYTIGYYESFGEPGKLMGAHIVLATQDGKIVQAMPAIRILPDQLQRINVAVPELKFEDGTPGVIMLERMDAGTKAATLKISLPGYSGRWEVPVEVTYKPWINVVWLGIIIAVAGTLLAMAHRSLEARRVRETVASKVPDGDEEPIVLPGPVPTPVGAAPFTETRPRGTRRLKPAPNKPA
ncbi:MAG: cytochrome c-type biogenesis CcmF C-terminal domain-containing protein [Chloroherpetonaceae bacterium]|nr:cytochrome c biogenesis protein CcsA [Chthonomonadaceae bacterium]MDW8208389.1 cytochrome c-type biogenesis CcmF C-terminal domain-containing protein [Chloroherpetonaceae bacterium]